MSYCLILTTTSSRQNARRLARVLLEHHAAACISLIPQVESHFRWQGKKEQSPEILLLIKTKRGLYKKAEALLRKHHAYTVPEILALPISKGSAAYLKWLRSETLH